MSKCIKCGSYAFNLYKEDIDQGGLCDVHYWQYRAHRAEALAEQPAQQIADSPDDWSDWKVIPPQSQPAQQQEPVLWLVNGVIQASDIPKDYTGCLFTSPPAQRTWVGLTDEETGQAINANFGTSLWAMAKDIEAKIKEKNT